MYNYTLLLLTKKITDWHASGIPLAAERSELCSLFCFRCQDPMVSKLSFQFCMTRNRSRWVLYTVYMHVQKMPSAESDHTAHCCLLQQQLLSKPVQKLNLGHSACKIDALPLSHGSWHQSIRTWRSRGEGSILRKSGEGAAFRVFQGADN